MSLPRADAKRLARFALLSRQPVEIEHPTITGHRIVGWLLEPGENYSVPDGIGMIEAIQRIYRMNLAATRRALLKSL